MIGECGQSKTLLFNTEEEEDKCEKVVRQRNIITIATI